MAIGRAPGRGFNELIRICMIAEDLKIDVAMLSEWLIGKKSVTVLDVRPKHEREEWSIPGSLHADVYDKLKANEKDVFSNLELPEGAIVTICAGGKMSLIAAEQLRQKGLDVYSLAGGMKAWNFAWNRAEISFRNFKIIQVRRSAKGCLSYLVGSGHDAIVIDASLDPKVYLGLAKDNGWKIRYVMDTHIHADYLSRTRDLAAAAGSTHLMIENANVDYPFVSTRDEEVISFGDTAIKVLHTPGHTWESASYQIDGLVLFTGDTLFLDGVGRPDLKADQDEAVKKSKQLHLSLKRLLELNPSAIVLPAHSSKAVPFDGKLLAATIVELREKLEWLKMNENEFVQYTLSHIPPTPPNYLTIAGLNKVGSYEGHKLSDLEAGANRCAIA